MEPPLALLPIGTGVTSRRTLGAADDLERAVERVLSAEPRAFDLGVLRLTTRRRDRGPRVPQHHELWPGRRADRPSTRGRSGSPEWHFYLATVRAIAAWRNPVVRVRVDGVPWLESPVVNVMIANGRYFGGGMKIAPEADPGDGRFDVVAIGDLGRLQTLGLTRAVYAGTHLGRRLITATRGIAVEHAAVATDVVLIDMDGETPGLLLSAARRGWAIWIRA